jgi:hypothetical protein
MNNENNMEVASAEAYMIGAIGVMFIQVISALAEQSNFDRKLLINQIQSFPDPHGGESFDRLYFLLKESLISKISQKNHE